MEIQEGGTSAGKTWKQINRINAMLLIGEPVELLCRNIQEYARKFKQQTGRELIYSPIDGQHNWYNLTSPQQ